MEFCIADECSLVFIFGYTNKCSTYTEYLLLHTHTHSLTLIPIVCCCRMRSQNAIIITISLNQCITCRIKFYTIYFYMYIYKCTMYLNNADEHSLIVSSLQNVQLNEQLNERFLFMYSVSKRIDLMLIRPRKT